MRILLASDFDDDLRPRPGASWWAQRVFWFAQPGDMVVVPDYPEKEFADYALRLLKVDPSSICVVYVDTGSVGKLTRANLLSRDALAAVRDLLPDPGEVEELIMLTPTVLGVEFAEALGLPQAAVAGGAFLSQGGGQFANSKALFRAVSLGNGVPVASGGVSGALPDSVRAVSQLLETSPVILKKEYMSGGSGNTLISLDASTQQNGAKHHVVLSSPDELDGWMQDSWAELTDNGRHRFVFERYFAGSRACFAEFKLAEGVVFSGSGEMHYLPLAASQTIPLPDIESPRGCALMQGAKAIAEAYHAMGYRGYVGVDAIFTPCGKLLFTEANSRVTGSTHIYVGLGERLLGSHYAQTHFLIDRIWPDNWRAASFGSALAALNEAGIAYDEEAQEGVVLCSALDRRDNTVMHCIVTRDLERSVPYYEALEELFRQR